jgi:hypothetical protein
VVKVKVGNRQRWITVQARLDLDARHRTLDAKRPIGLKAAKQDPTMGAKASRVSSWCAHIRDSINRIAIKRRFLFA